MQKINKVFKNAKAGGNKAFTLIELLVVIAIIALLSSVVLNSLASARMKANDAKIVQDLRQFRNAVELYYNDNHAYPPDAVVISSNLQEKDNLTYKDSLESGNANWSDKLSFFIKKAEAAVTHTHTPLCANFDGISAVLVQKKYLSSIPVHPYDNDVAGICYKARAVGTSFTAYAVLSSKLSNGSNKRTGFVVGDTSVANLNTIKIATTETTWKGYPSALGSSATISSVSDIADDVQGITIGSGNSYGSGITSTQTSNYSLTFNSTGEAPSSVTISPANTPYVSGTTFPSGTVVNLLAYSQNGAATSWTGCDSFLGSSCTVTMNANKTVTADFAPSMYILHTSVAEGPSGQIITPGNNSSFTPGDTIWVQAYPYDFDTTEFDYWSGDCMEIMQNSCSVLMDADKSVIAHFRLKSN
ncbi:MAG: type II secretion system protein [bacterium]